MEPGKRDRDRIVNRVFADDAVIVDPNNGGTFKGIEAVSRCAFEREDWKTDCIHHTGQEILREAATGLHPQRSRCERGRGAVGESLSSPDWISRDGGGVRAN